MDNLDEELGNLTPITPAFTTAISNCLKQATLCGASLVGMLIVPGDPPLISVVTNKHLGYKDLSELFHLYGDVILTKSQTDGFADVDITSHADKDEPEDDVEDDENED